MANLATLNLFSVDTQGLRQKNEHMFIWQQPLELLLQFEINCPPDIQRKNGSIISK